MASTSAPRLLILETSGRVGQVALAQGSTLLQWRHLDETRRHARDLAPAVAELLVALGWRPRDLHGVVVSRGPGSYTGLRVGIMSAKAFAYATGCALIAVDTFAAIARQAPAAASRLEILADAQQDKIYVQSWERSVPAGEWQPLADLTIRPFDRWLATLEAMVWVTGPGLGKYQHQLPAGCPIVEASCWEPHPNSLLQIGLARYVTADKDDLWTLEPLYLRPSSAEEIWRSRS